MTRSYSKTLYTNKFDPEHPINYDKKYLFKNRNGKKKHGDKLEAKYGGYRKKCTMCGKRKECPESNYSFDKPLNNTIIDDSYHLITDDDLYSNGMLIRQIFEPTDEQLFIAIKQNGLVIKYIKQTPEMCLIAVKQNGMALQFIKDQNDQLCKAAVYQNSHALKFITNQTDEIILIATDKNPYSTTYIKKPSIDIYTKIAKKNIKAFKFMEKLYLTNTFTNSIWEHHLAINGIQIKLCPTQTFGLCDIAINQNPNAIKFIDLSRISHDHYFELCQTAVNINGNVIKYLIDINENFYSAATDMIGTDIKFYFSSGEINSLIKTAINQNGLALKYINANYQTYDICKLAVEKSNMHVLNYIKNNYYKYILNYNNYAIISTPIEDCSICFSDEKYFLKNTTCRHMYCRNCIVKINKCPMCRTQIRQVSGFTNISKS
jgi:hypothetical protein